jgi:hypothetical protein
MSDENRDILEDVAGANPVTERDLPDSDLRREGDELLAKIRARLAEDRRGQTRGRLRRRLAWAAVGLAVVLAAVLLPLFLIHSGKIAPVTAYHGSTTSTTEHVIQAVTRRAALTGILELAKELGLVKSSITTAPSTDAGLVNEALSVGILLPSEGPDYQLWQVTTRAQYALWLWRAFGKYLPEKTSVQFKDIGSLTGEEQLAIKGLAAAGVVDANGGYFKGAADITQSVEQTLLEQVEQAIQGSR